MLPGRYPKWVVNNSFLKALTVLIKPLFLYNAQTVS